MKAKTLKALEGSIKKWEAIVAGTGVDRGPDNCPLCQLFNDGTQEDECRGCPVFDKTGETGCDKTPYVDFYKALRFADDKKAASKFAQEELHFLKSLLPAASAEGAAK